MHGLGAVEKDLALVGEVPEEGPLRDAGTLGDVVGGGLIEAALIGRFLGIDIAASSARTRELLGWTPPGPSVFEDIAAGAYALPE